MTDLEPGRAHDARTDRAPDFALGSDGRIVLAFGFSEQGFPTPPPFFEARIGRCSDTACSSMVEQQRARLARLSFDTPLEPRPR
jgi:hypothetical protein